jgi:hypothetical protein
MAEFNYNEEFGHKSDILYFLANNYYDNMLECPDEEDDINYRVCFHNSLVKTEHTGLHRYPNDKPFVRHAMRMISEILVFDFVGYRVGTKHPDYSEEYEREWNLKHSIYSHLENHYKELRAMCNDDDNIYECKLIALEATERYGRHQFPDNIDLIKNVMEYLRLMAVIYQYLFGYILREGGRRRTNRKHRRTNRTNRKHRRTTRKHRRTRRRC